MRTPPKFQVAIFDFNKAHKAIRTLVLYPRLDGYFDIWESYNGQGGIIVPLIQTNWEIEKISINIKIRKKFRIFDEEKKTNGK